MIAQGYCLNCDDVGTGNLPRTNHLFWFLVNVLFFWPLGACTFGVTAIFGIAFWIMDAQGKKGAAPTCPTCGWRMWQTKAAGEAHRAKVVKAQERAQQSREKKDAAILERLTLEAEGVDARHPVIRWAFPRKKKARRRRRR